MAARLFCFRWRWVVDKSLEKEMDDDDGLNLFSSTHPLYFTLETWLRVSQRSSWASCLSSLRLNCFMSCGYRTESSKGKEEGPL